MKYDLGKGEVKMVQESLVPSVDEGKPVLNRNSQERIGDHLRALYDELLHQPVPDRFKELLEKLDKASNRSPESIVQGDTP